MAVRDYRLSVSTAALLWCPAPCSRNVKCVLCTHDLAIPTSFLTIHFSCLSILALICGFAILGIFQKKMRANNDNSP